MKIKVTIDVEGQEPCIFEYDSELIQYRQQDYKDLCNKLDEIGKIDNRAALMCCNEWPLNLHEEEQGYCIYCKHCKVRTPWYGNGVKFNVGRYCDIQIPTWLHNEIRLAWNKGLREPLEEKYTK